MSAPLLPGWTAAFTRDVSSPDEATQAAALGRKPRRCIRVSEEDTAKSRRRGQRRGQRTRRVLRLLEGT